MTRRLVSAHAVPTLAAVAILALTPAAHAQRFMGGGGRSYGSYSYSPGYYGGYRSPGFYGYSPGYYGGYYQPHVNLYGYQGNFRSYAPYSIDNYGYYQPFGMSFNSPMQPAPAAASAAPTGTSQSLYSPSGNATRLTVRLPADARLWVDDFQPQLTGTVRVLTTPPLQPGQNYHYTVKAQWNENGRPVTQERTVRFQAGGDMTVDFTQPPPPPLNPNPPVTTPPNAPS